MKTIQNIDFLDFYFNGHYLSEFGGMIGGADRLSEYPLLPKRNFITDRAIGQDGNTVFDSYLDPRQFEVPIFFENIDSAGIRNIAAWLNVKEDVPFWYKGDSLKLSCTLDANDFSLETISGADGHTSLKFIAHDPYFYEVNPSAFEYELSEKSNTISFENLGTVECYPLISIIGSGEITLSIIDSNKNELSKCTIKDVKQGVFLDSTQHTCYTVDLANSYQNFSGTFPIIPVGKSNIKVEGNVTTITVTPNYRWI